MNGLQSELRDRLLSLSAHARVVDPRPAALADESALLQRLARLPGVAGAAPCIDLQALAVHGTEMVPVTLRGIDPGREDQVTSTSALLVSGHLADLAPGSGRLIIGAALAAQLGAGPGTSLTLLVPVTGAGGIPEPRMRVYTVSGEFEAGVQDHDGALVLAALEDVRALAPAAEAVASVRLRFRDALAAPRFLPAVRAAAGPAMRVSDWTQDNAGYFRAIRIEKTMVALILMLIVGVAAFNIVAMLVMVVNDKRTDIAILRTLGATPGDVLRVFVTQGLAIGWCGVLAGALGGVLVAANVAAIAPFLERVLGFHFFDADVYYITSLPSELRAVDVAWITAAALLLTLAATVYPALRAAATPPAAALRYE
jgi:lipoprotein-releasing system permease protein